MPATPGRRPNVLVFFTDQQRWDASSLEGNPLDVMPNFDRFAQRGTHLPLAFTNQPVCGPARAVIQTGQYATTAGVWRNGRPIPIDGRATMGQCFKDAGYQTGYIGKWHLAANDECSPWACAVPPKYRAGYDYWLGANALEHTSDVYKTIVYDNDDNEVFLPGYRVDALTDKGIQYIHDRKDADDPFFLMMSFLEPHHQNHVDDYPPPDGYRERYAGKWTPPDLAALPAHDDPERGLAGGSTHQHLGGYWGMIKRLDEAFGRMLDALKSMNLLEDTIVLFMSDHGCHFKTRNNEYKRSCHDASIHIPMALSGPGFTGGGRINELVSLVDIAPTLLDACGINVPDSMQGRSFLPLAQRQPVDWPDDVFVQISETQTGRCVRTKKWKYSVSVPEINESSPTYKEDFLYDLEHDPYELRNLIDQRSHRPVAERMKQRLLARMEQAGEEAPTIEPVEDVPSGQRIVEPHEIDM